VVLQADPECFGEFLRSAKKRKNMLFLIGAGANAQLAIQ
jgi:hypothetical protein